MNSYLQYELEQFESENMILTRDNEILQQRLSDKDYEIDRLNNIINEFEELLNQMILDTKKPTVLNNREKMAIRVAIEHILDKLKELKEKK